MGLFLIQKIWFMSYKDALLGPLFLLLVFFIASMLKNRLCKTELEKKIYTRALLLKLFGATFFALIYEFYYRGGDTMGFYAWAENFFTYLTTDTFAALEFLFTDNAASFYKFKYNNYASSYGYLLKYMTREHTFIKMTSVINIFALNSYLSTTYLFTLFSFIGNWLLFRVFIDYFPQIKKNLAWAVLYIPSVAFWGSGILKDTITFGALGFLVFTVYKVFIKRNKIVRNVFFMLLSVYLIMILKAYIFIAFLPAGIFWVFNSHKEKIKSSFLKAILTPFFIILMGATLAGLIFIVGENAGRFSMSQLEQTTKDFQGWHQVASENGSGYIIHNTGTSISSLISAFPESVNVTYFRPYLWESGSIVVFIGAVESLVIFLYFLKIFFFKGRIFRFIKAINSNAIIQMCLIFALFFGFVVGFTSFNFGALARYKIPSMPFFVAFLVMTSYQIDVLSGKIKDK